MRALNLFIFILLKVAESVTTIYPTPSATHATDVPIQTTSALAGGVGGVQSPASGGGSSGGVTSGSTGSIGSKPTPTTLTYASTTPVVIAAAPPQLQSSSSKQSSADYSEGLLNFADVVMGFAFSVSLISTIPTVRKIRKNGLSKHLGGTLAFQILVIVEQALGVWGRYGGYDTVKVAITWIIMFLSLANRIYCVRMTQLLIPGFRNLAIYAYIFNIVFFLAVASPIFSWWWNTNDKFTMWLVVGLPIWVLSIFLYEVGSLWIIGNILYRKTTRLNWYNQVHITSTKRKFLLLLLVLFLVMATDIFGLVAMGFAYFASVGSPDQLSWARISLYMLPIHFVCMSLGLNLATDLGYSVPSNRNSVQSTQSNLRILQS